MIIVLFDIDGTLIGGKNYWEHLLYSAVEKATNSSLHNNYYEVCGKTDPQIISDLVTLNTQKPLIQSSIITAKEFYLESFNDDSTVKNFKVLPHVRSVLKKLSIDNYILGVVTGNFRKSGTAKLKLKGLADLFNLEISSFSEDGITRVDLLESSLKKIQHYYGNSSHHIFYVGDTNNDVTSGNKLNLNTIGVGSKTLVKNSTEAINQPNLHISSWKNSAHFLEFIRSFR